MKAPSAHILLDTYNLRLRQGSGIKTYGLSLLEALHRLGHPVGMLTDRAVPRTRHGVLKEVLLYDQTRPQKRWAKVMQSVRDAAPLGSPMQIDLSSDASYVIRRNGYVPANVTHVHNLRNVYERANWKFKRFGLLTKLSVRGGARVWHATSPLPIRIRGAQMVTTIHDLIPLRLPYATLDDKQFFYKVVDRSLRDSALVLAVSECTKKDILQLFDLEPDKIVVTYQSLPAAAPPPHENFAQTLLKRHQLAPQHFVLFVGNIEPKKNLAMLIRAFSMLPDDLPLVVVGRKAWLWKAQLDAARQYFGSDADRRVRLLGYAPIEVVQALYANALCLAFPSLYEGFGLPPLEAMRQGCPVIASNVASLPEVCGDAALFVNPVDPDEIRAAVEQLLLHPEDRTRLIQAGHKRVEFFSAANYAMRLEQAYRRLT